MQCRCPKVHSRSPVALPTPFLYSSICPRPSAVEAASRPRQRLRQRRCAFLSYIVSSVFGGCACSVGP
eukprot:11227304-Lingulodinium_polyedra.AAC.1